MQKQQEVLGRLTQRHQQEYLLLINLVSKYARPDQDQSEEPLPVPVIAAEHRA